MSSNTQSAKSAPRPTLGDVAAAAGVAVSTASRALASPGRGNAETRDRIIQVAEELGYQPPRQVRSASRAAPMVAVLVSDVTNPFHFGIIRSTQQALRAAGYSQILVHTEDSPELEENALTRLRGTCDGVILAASRLSDERLAALSAVLPLVALNRAVPGVPSIVFDAPHGLDQAIEHLASLGHQRICYVAGPPASWAGNLRWRAVMAACKRLGIDCVKVGPFQPRTTSGAAAADAALNTGATACVAFNDLLAIGMLGRLKERGVRVPDDISIVGYDDIFGADFCNPPLTTLTAPIDQAARMSVSLLLERMQQNPGPVARGRQVATLPTHLTVRESTGPARRTQGAS